MNSDLTFKGGSSDGMFSVQDVKNQMKCTPAHEKELLRIKRSMLFLCAESITIMNTINYNISCSSSVLQPLIKITSNSKCTST